MLMQHTYFAGIGAGNAAVATVIQYICPALVICWVALRRKKGTGDGWHVCCSAGGRRCISSGDRGDPRTLSVPAECIYYSILSAVFYAFCSIYPKQLMMTLDNSFLLMFGMLFGGIMGYMADPVTDLGTFFHDDVLFDIFMIIICGTVIAFICYNAGLAWLTEEQTSVTRPWNRLFLSSHPISFWNDVRFVWRNRDHYGFICYSYAGHGKMAWKLVFPLWSSAIMCTEWNTNNCR